MSTVKDLVQLGRHVAAKHGWPLAKAFKSYEMSEADGAILSRCAVELLRIFPSRPGTSAQMSAALAVSLERHLKVPACVMAGTLAVEGVPVFGDRRPFDGARVFGEADPEWSGHAWLMVGPYIVDISIFRTAYSAWGPAGLAKYVDLTFGPNKGLYVDLWKQTRQQGLSYEPQYVLGADEVTGLMGSAYRFIEQARDVRA
jgi:hypothetical protein